MDGWGSLTMLIKRQNANKYRKSELRYELQKKKESYLKDAYNTRESFEFPEISLDEMIVLKEEIRAKLKRDKIKNILSYIVVVGLIFMFFMLLYFGLMLIRSS